MPRGLKSTTVILLLIGLSVEYRAGVKPRLANMSAARRICLAVVISIKSLISPFQITVQS